MSTDYKKKSDSIHHMVLRRIFFIYGSRFVIYPSEGKRFCRMSNFGVQTGRVLSSGVRVWALFMSSCTWQQRRVDNIVLTIDYQKSQRCYSPHGTMNEKCNLWRSLCYLSLGSQAIFRNVTLRCPNGSSFSLGLGLRPWSCNLLHGNNEGWITLSLP